MEQIAIVPITCESTCIAFIKKSVDEINLSTQSVSLNPITSIMMIVNDYGITVPTDDLDIYLNILKQKIFEKEEKINLSIECIIESKIPDESYYSKKLNQQISSLVHIADSQNNALVNRVEALLKKINTLFVRAHKNDKNLLIFLNKEDSVHRYASSVLEISRELYLETAKSALEDAIINTPQMMLL
jgi:hypothetical protein